MSGRREGFSIIEVVVALVLLTLILLPLAGLTNTAARQSLVAADRQTHQAARLQVLNRYAALPYDSLTAGYSRTDTTGTPNNRVQRRVSVARSGGAAHVVIVTVPLQRSARPDTVRFSRAAPATVNPLCIGC